MRSRPRTIRSSVMTEPVQGADAWQADIRVFGAKMQGMLRNACVRMHLEGQTGENM